MRQGTWFILGLVVVVALGAMGIGMRGNRSVTRQSGKRLQVVTTILPVYVFTANVAAGVADVQNLLPPGAESHDYSFTPKDARMVAEADLVVQNGLGYDRWIEQAMQAADKPKQALVDASSLVDVTRPGLSIMGREESGMQMQPGTVNPHIWINPAYAVHMVEAIRNALMIADPANRETYAKNAEAYLQKLLVLDGSFRELAAQISTKSYVAEEPSFSYLASEYGFSEVAVIANAPGIAASAKARAELVKEMQAKKVRVIFKNLGSDSATVAALAKDSGARVVELDPLEFGALTLDTYERTQERNIGVMRQSLQ